MIAWVFRQRTRMAWITRVKRDLFLMAKRISETSVHDFFVKNPRVSAQSALSAFTIPLKSEQMHETTIKLRFYPHERDVLQNLVQIF